MNKEIKEILEYLKCDDTYEVGNGDYEKKLYKYEINLLLDYITNLQEEKDKLKAELELYKDNHNYLNDKIDKAIKYIEKHNPSDIGICGNDIKKYYTLKEDSVDNLLNILQGKSDE